MSPRTTIAIAFALVLLAAAFFSPAAPPLPPAPTTPTVTNAKPARGRPLATETSRSEDVPTVAPETRDPRSAVPTLASAAPLGAALSLALAHAATPRRASGAWALRAPRTRPLRC